jgi:superfamily II DNA helicase RecQ
MLCFLQETGRLGRDGLPSSSVLIYSKLPMYGEPLRDEHLGVLPMREFIQTEGCRRLTFQHFDPDAHSCSSITGTLLCDNCQLLKNVRDFLRSNALTMTDLFLVCRHYCKTGSLDASQQTHIPHAY